MQKLIVALGNPGTQYAKTRHNIAWAAFDFLNFKERLNWQEKFKGLYSSTTIDGEKIHFLKPLTFMNLSGESVAKLVSFFKIEGQNILVLQDEIDLDFGCVMFKNGGGLAGHNGLKSIAKCLGYQDFHRLRLGIGRPKRGSVSAHVLSEFSADEKISLDQYLPAVAGACDFYLAKGLEKAANHFNKKKL